ncbi:MAG: hypothetical protein ABIJ12_04160 [bacterium]
MNIIKIIHLSLLILFLCLTNASGTNLISYQGKLTNADGLPVPDNNYTVTFTITSDISGTHSVWSETAVVSTGDGLFNHYLGSVTNLPSSLFVEYDSLYLKVTVNGESVTPPSRLATVPSAIVASNLKITNDTGLVLAQTSTGIGAIFQLFDTTGKPLITFNSGRDDDSSVVLPEASINSEEIMDEPGVASRNSNSLIELSTSSMIDLVTLNITIPAPGFIMLYGKCYLLLSGTTGANSARVQIDDEEGGPTLFPYYAQAGLSGYVNTGINYFPIFVTRIFYGDTTGTYTFHLEGKAENSLPALAQTWDHILTAAYFPSSYGYVSTITNNPNGFTNPVLLQSDTSAERSGNFYDVDLRELEKKKK